MVTPLKFDCMKTVNHCILTICSPDFLQVHKYHPRCGKSIANVQAALSPDDVLLRPTLRASEPLLRALEATLAKCGRFP